MLNKQCGLLLSATLLFQPICYALSNNSDFEIETKKLHQGDVVNKAVHSKKVQNQKLKTPRTLSPIEFEKAQRDQNSSEFQRATDTNRRWAVPQINSRTKANKAAKANTSCTSTDSLLGLSDQALVDAVKQGQLTSCLYGLYNTAYVGSELFSDANLMTIVGAINELLINYAGTTATGATELEKLVTFLRAMHWAETSSGSNRAFTNEYQVALQQAFDDYFAGDHFVNFNGDGSRNFMIRYEMLILVNSSNTDRQRHLLRFSEAILGYGLTASQINDWGIGYEESGMTGLLTQFFNALEYEETASATTIENNPVIVDNLVQFVRTSGAWLIGHTREYQWSDSVSELGRLLKLGGITADKVRPTMQHILSTYSYDGAGGNGWINAQSMVSAYDSANCDLYGNACNFDLENTILSGNHVCSDTIKVRYQGILSNNNLNQICSSLAAQEIEFKQLFNNPEPVANDNNTNLEIVIFSSSTDYQNHAGTFFGINTNNGGMYLEGEPAGANNQARFIAYQATWLQPEFVVWNLNHEYIHYLDGRFNNWGSFNDQAANSVWWSEGLAEYLSQPDNNPNALAAAANNTYSLSELFQTTYANSNTARTYYWGYLAVRYMMENQRNEVDNTLLPTLRAVKYQVSTQPCQFDWQWKTKDEAIENGWYWAYDDSEWSTGYWVWTCGQGAPDDTPLPEFTPYQDILSQWGNGFDADFTQWLSCLVAGEGICTTQTNPADLDGNSVIDRRDINLFLQLLRQSGELDLSLDFNQDEKVDRRDVRAMSMLCDLPRCAIAP